MIITYFGLVSCNAQTNTTDFQVSKNITNSTKDGFYISSYRIETDSTIKFGEIWMEHNWKYADFDNGIIKVIKNGCQLCFQIEQDSTLEYSVKSFYNWHMVNNGNYVGTHGIDYKNNFGLYSLDIPNCEYHDSIKIGLIKVIDSNGNIIKKKIKDLIFYKTK